MKPVTIYRDLNDSHTRNRKWTRMNANKKIRTMYCKREIIDYNMISNT